MCSWSRFANVLFLEQPAGVGFSYCDQQIECFFDDDSASDDLYEFLLVRLNVLVMLCSLHQQRLGASAVRPMQMLPIYPPTFAAVCSGALLVNGCSDTLSPYTSGFMDSLGHS